NAPRRDVHADNLRKAVSEGRYLLPRPYYAPNAAEDSLTALKAQAHTLQAVIDNPAASAADKAHAQAELDRVKQLIQPLEQMHPVGPHATPSPAGAAPTAAEQLEQKQRALHDAETALAAAEVAMDVQRVVVLQNEVAVIRRFIGRLAATAAVEGAAEAKEEAAQLDAKLRATYAAKRAALAPDIEQARLAIKAMTDSVRKCARTWSAAQRAGFEVQLNAMRFGLDGPP